MWLGIVYSFSFQENGRFYLLYFVDDEEDDSEKFELSGMMRVKMLFELVLKRILEMEMFMSRGLSFSCLNCF